MRDKTEWGLVSVVPLIVVDQRPDKIATHVVAIINRFLDLQHVIEKVADTFDVLGGGNAIFRDHYRLPIAAAERSGSACKGNGAG